MNRALLAFATALAVVTAAHGIVVYNQLGQNFDTADPAWDGGGSIFGSNFGCQVGQQMTVPNGATSITAVTTENILLTVTGSVPALVSVHEIISGTPQTTAYSSATVTASVVYDRTDATFGVDIYLISLSGLNLALPVPGTDIVVQLQPQSGDWGYVLRNSVNPVADSYSRDYSSFGYGSVYGHSNWVSFSPAFSDVSMKVEAVPEPASLLAAAIGSLALLRRRRGATAV